jgi:hypothetical protein
MIFSLAAFIEREAGYSLISLFLIALGVYLLDPNGRVKAAEHLISFSLGVLARSMGSFKKAQNEPVSSASLPPGPRP